jgi:hydroxyacylglutathione hydrolase
MIADGVSIQPIPAFRDNYIWMFHDGSRAVVVDPGVAPPVLKVLDKLGLELHAIVLTHLHYDHNLGVPGLLERFPFIPVHGPWLNDHDLSSHPPFPKPGTVPLDCVTHVVEDGDIIELKEMGISLSVIAVPGHTLGHLAFLQPERGWLFSGDTLFAGGCGKVFGGSMKSMVDSLDRLAGLPEQTRVYCAHEYTVDNLRFALAVEPSNPHLAARIRHEEEKRGRGEPTLPSTIGLERATNPFLRVMQPEVLRSLRSQRGLEAPDRVAAFETLRTWKNEFKS